MTDNMDITSTEITVTINPVQTQLTHWLLLGQQTNKGLIFKGGDAQTIIHNRNYKQTWQKP